jgi:hypothetical protein
MKRNRVGRRPSRWALRKKFGPKTYPIPKNGIVVNDLPHTANPMWGNDTGRLGDAR